MKPKKERWSLEFEKAGLEERGPPTVILVRKLLKAALRAYGLRCTGHKITQEGHTPAIDPEIDCTRNEPPF